MPPRSSDSGRTGSDEVSGILGWDSNYGGLKAWLAGKGLFPDGATKPPDPKKAMKEALREKNNERLQRYSANSRDPLHYKDVIVLRSVSLEILFKRGFLPTLTELSQQHALAALRSGSSRCFFLLATARRQSWKSVPAISAQAARKSRSGAGAS